MERITSPKQLQIAGFKTHGCDTVRSAIKNFTNLFKVLTLGADVWRILKLSTLKRILDCECYGEIVGIEVPGKSIPLLRDIDNDVRQWVSITIELLFPQTGLNERVEGGKIMDGAKRPFGREIVGRNETVGTIKELASRII